MISRDVCQWRASYSWLDAKLGPWVHFWPPVRINRLSVVEREREQRSILGSNDTAAISASDQVSAFFCDSRDQHSIAESASRRSRSRDPTPLATQQMNSFILLRCTTRKYSQFTFNVNAQVDLVDEMNKTPLEGHRKRNRRKSMAIRNSQGTCWASGQAGPAGSWAASKWIRFLPLTLIRRNQLLRLPKSEVNSINDNDTFCGIQPVQRVVC